MKILIPAGTKVNVNNGSRYVSVITRKELKLDVVRKQNKKYFFEFPIMKRRGWVEKHKTVKVSDGE